MFDHLQAWLDKHQPQFDWRSELMSVSWIATGNSGVFCFDVPPGYTLKGKDPAHTLITVNNRVISSGVSLESHITIEHGFILERCAIIFDTLTTPLDRDCVQLLYSAIRKGKKQK
jgi:hypothetical protein